MQPKAELLGPNAQGSPEYAKLEAEVQQCATQCLKDARPRLKNTKAAMLADINERMGPGGSAGSSVSGGAAAAGPASRWIPIVYGCVGLAAGFALARNRAKA